MPQQLYDKLHQVTNPRARSKYVCEFCQGVIFPGDRYICGIKSYTSYHEKGGFRRVHETCYWKAVNENLQPQ